MPHPSALPAYRRPALIALVAAGGVAGTFARHGLGLAFPQADGQWPVTTFAINIVGAFLLGMLLEALTRLRGDVGEGMRMRTVRLAGGTGALGAFTTYSTLAVDTDVLVHGGHAGAAVSYAVATVLVGVVACAAGMAVGARLAAARESGGGAR